MSAYLSPVCLSASCLSVCLSPVCLQGVLAPPFVNQLFALVLAVPLSLPRRQVHVSSLVWPDRLLAPPFTCTRTSGSTSSSSGDEMEGQDERDPWGWERGEGGGGGGGGGTERGEGAVSVSVSGSGLQAGVLLRSVTAYMHLHTHQQQQQQQQSQQQSQQQHIQQQLLQCEQVRGLHDLFFARRPAGAAAGAADTRQSGSDSDSVWIAQPPLPLLEVACLKCLSAILIPVSEV